MQFYEQVFGLQRRSIRENGPLGLYAELETGATTLAIADTRKADAIFGGAYRPNRADKVPGAFQITFVTEDVEATYTAALQAGATAHTPPQRQPWEQTIGRVRDPHGVFVSIASPLPEHPVAPGV